MGTAHGVQGLRPCAAAAWAASWPGITLSEPGFLSRTMASLIEEPGAAAWTFLVSSLAFLTGSPLTEVIASPFRKLACRRAAVLDAGDDRAAEIIRAEAFSNIGGDRSNLNSNPSARDHALVLQLRDHRFHRVRGNRKGNADRAARGRKDHAVHTDDIAMRVETGRARIAAIDLCIDLNEIVRRTRRKVARTR